jgi:hypothetical protein
MARRGRFLMMLFAAAGAAWGFAAYRILWGYTQVVVDRQFVDSVAGLLALLPVRAVVAVIDLVERDVAHRTFDLSNNNAWIGVAAAVVGAAVVALAWWIVRAPLRLLFRPSREEEATTSDAAAEGQPVNP